MTPVFRLLLTLALWLPAAVLAVESHAVVFVYHRFGEDRHPSTSVGLEQFDAHLEYLATKGYQVWPLERIVSHLREGQPIPDRTVAITVDDAYLSAYREAYSRLRERGWPFTVFVSTDPVDARLPDFMSWDQIREMQANGVRFANHGASHGHLVERLPGEDAAGWRKRITGDLDKAQRRLLEELGPKAEGLPRLFAYPYGEYDTELAELVKGLGYIAFGQQSGVVSRWSDTRALPRFPMATDFAELRGFAVKAASLPLPVTAVSPWDPVVRGENPPRLEVTMAEGEARLSELACYASGFGRVSVEWLDKDKTRFVVTAPAPLSRGRNRYNCTAPVGATGRYGWFSQPWLILPGAAAPGDPDH